MTTPTPPAADSELQFQTVEPAPTDDSTPGVQGCAACKKPLVDEYYALGADAICPECRAQLNPVVTGTRFTGLFKATLFGLVAGLVGATIWYIVRRVTEYEIGLIAILVGFMVGKAVHIGSGSRGGRGYQIIAVVLTYCCIAANYIPDIASELMKQMREERSQMASIEDTADMSNVVETNPAVGLPASAPVNSTVTTQAIASAEATTAAVAGSNSITASIASNDEEFSALEMVIAVVVLSGLVFAFALAAPFLMGATNIIGLLIIGFALWEAWKFNRRVVLPITGPYRVGDESNMPPPIEPTAPAGGSNT